jgi:hypothetical protein
VGGSFDSTVHDANVVAGYMRQEPLAYLGLAYRHGIGKAMDIGVQGNLSGSIMAYVQHRLIDGARFDVATGIALGSAALPVAPPVSPQDGSGYGPDRHNRRFFQVTLPLHLSYTLTQEWFTSYASPRLTWRNRSPHGDGAQALLGVTVGMRIGKEQGAYIEYGYQEDLRSSYSAKQIGIAWFWRR